MVTTRSPGEATGHDRPGEAARPLGNFELFLLTLSILSLVNLVLAQVVLSPDAREVIQTVDRGLSVFFLADFVYQFLSASQKWRYFLGGPGWLDLLGSLPIPALRLARIPRIVREIRLLRRAGGGQFWVTVVRNRAESALLTVVFLVVILLEVASWLVLVVERGNPQANIHTASDALWWTYSTVTTVGYGDRFPVSDAGRLVGAVTLTLGVGLFGTLSGYLANTFLRPRSERTRQAGQEEVDSAIRGELAEIRRQLLLLQVGSGATSTAPPPEGREQQTV